VTVAGRRYRQGATDIQVEVRGNADNSDSDKTQEQHQGLDNDQCLLRKSVTTDHLVCETESTQRIQSLNILPTQIDYICIHLNY
jgi:hypothetical protein